MNTRDYNHYLAEDLAHEIFNHERPTDPEELTEFIEKFLNKQNEQE